MITPYEMDSANCLRHCMKRSHQFPFSEPSQLLFFLPRMLFHQTYLTFLNSSPCPSLPLFISPYFSSKLLLHPNHQVFAALFLFHRHLMVKSSLRDRGHLGEQNTQKSCLPRAHSVSPTRMRLQEVGHCLPWSQLLPRH